MQTPEGLRISIEKLMLNVTETLDPYIGLKLAQLTVQVADLAYVMGHQDANRQATVCPTCPFKNLP